MKPIIVTYSNESYKIRTSVLLQGKEYCYYCKHLITKVIKRIWVSDIKLIARPKK